MNKIFLANNDDPLGLRDIQPPVGSSNVNDPNSGLVMFVNRGFTLLFMGFGLYVLVNFIRASFWFISAQGDAKNIEKAKSTLTQSAVGLILALLVFVVAGVIGQVFFGNWNFLLDPVKSLEDQGVLRQ